MLSANNVKNPSKIRSKKRVGRWNGSGKWTFSWRGCNWQNSRSGWKVPSWFEWGQTPLFRRLPKLRGFSNARFKKEFNIVNCSDIERLASKWIKVINREVLEKENCIRKNLLFIKILWDWAVKTKVTVVADRASTSAIAKIEKAWGKVNLFAWGKAENKEETVALKEEIVEQKAEEVKEEKKVEKKETKAKAEKKEVKTEAKKKPAKK